MITRTRIVAALTAGALGLTPVAALAQETDAPTDRQQTDQQETDRQQTDRPERDRPVHDLGEAKERLLAHVERGRAHLDRAERLVTSSDVLSEVNRRFLLDQIAEGRAILDGFERDIEAAETWTELKEVAAEMRVTWHKAVLASGRAHLLLASDRIVDGAQRVDELGDRIAERAENVDDPDLARALIRIGERLEAAADEATAIALRTANTLRTAEPQSFEEAHALLRESRDRLEDAREVLQDALDALEDLIDDRR